MAEKRRNYGDEFKREAVRLVTEHGYGVSETARNLGINAHMLGAGNVRLKRNRAQPFPGTVACRPTRKNYSSYARTISGFGWNVTF